MLSLYESPDAYAHQVDMPDVAGEVLRAIQAGVADYIVEATQR
jgi:hypothetical protein